MPYCHSCKSVSAETVYTDENNLGYCEKCLSDRPIPPEFFGLVQLLATVPFHKGDRVECRTEGHIYDGVGVVQEVSFLPKDGGSPVFPAFRVQLEERSQDLPEDCPSELWYLEDCLRRTD